MTPVSVCWFVGHSQGLLVDWLFWSVRHNFLKGRKLHLHAPSEHLFFSFIYILSKKEQGLITDAQKKNGISPPGPFILHSYQNI